jgi:type II secretory pathway predicted ATPase ExeA
MNASLAAILQRLDDPGCLHLSQGFTEALARLHFAVEHRLGLAVLLGAGGTGKTTLLRRVARELAVSPGCVVSLRLAGLSVADLQSTFAQQLGLRTQRIWPRMVERLTEMAYDQVPVIVLADEADRVSSGSLDFLGRLWDADPTGQLRITMVAATDELALAAWPDAWLQRVDLRVELQAWSVDDTTQFLQSIIGDERKRNWGFESPAIERLHELSQGLPRLLRRYAHLSLLATESQQRTMVDDATVMGATHELCGLGASRPGDGAAIEFIDDFLIT